MNTPPPLPLGERLQVGRSRLRHDPRNPRGKINPKSRAVVDMAKSMTAHGQIEPMVARPTPEPDAPDALTIVCGHVRDVALELSGITHADVIVREMTPEQAFEVMAVENGHREAVPPLGEARAFDLIVQTTGSVEAAAKRVSMPTRYVRDRLTLLALDEPVQMRLAAGQLPIEHALSIARFPRELHVEAMNAVIHDDGTVMALRDATQILRSRFSLRLEMAPFDRADASLLPDAGPCTTCPKRSGVQGELFANIGTPDLCLDSVCFGEKRDAAWKARSEQHEKKSLGPVVTGKSEARKLLEDPAFIDLEASCPHESTTRPWKEVLGPRAMKSLPTTLVRDKEKGVHELVQLAHLEVAKLTGKPKELIDLETQRRAEQRQAEVDAADRENKKLARTATLVNDVSALVQAGEVSSELGRALAFAAVEVAWPETLKLFAKHNAITGWNGPTVVEEVRDFIGAMPTGLAALSVAVELIVLRASQRGEDPFASTAPLGLILAALKGSKTKTSTPDPKTPPEARKKAKKKGSPPDPKSTKKTPPKGKKGSAK